MEKKRNLWVIPTDKPSRLWINNLLQGKLELSKEVLPYNTSRNIYITSDEVIKDGEWHLHYYEGKPIISKSYNSAVKVINEVAEQFDYKKIILTTDPNLIKNGVQPIPDEFLEWFSSKNGNVNFVEVISLRKSSGYYDEKEVWHWDFLAYKIITPKEEHKQVISVRLENSLKQFNLTLEEALNIEQSKLKQIGFGNRSIIELQNLKSKQETLEEAAEKLTNDFPVLEVRFNLTNEEIYGWFLEALQKGAKWQQERMYSEKESIQKIIDYVDFQFNTNGELNSEIKKWFEQFSKLKNG